MIYFWLTVILTVSVIFVVSRRSFWFASPSVLFTAINTLMLVGTSALVDSRQAVEAEYLWLLLATQAAYLLITIPLTALRGATDARNLRAWKRRETEGWTWIVAKRLSLVLLMSSLILSVYYYYVAGGNLFLSQFIGEVDVKDAATMATLRLGYYSGDRYLAPGYINQFKNTILPTLLGIYCAGALSGHQRRWVAMVLALVTIPLLLGTGQRAPVLVALLIVVGVVMGVARPSRQRRLLLLAVFVVCMALLSVATLNLRRIERGGGPSDQAVAITRALGGRLFVTNQLGGLVGYLYVRRLPIQLGAEWVEGLKSISPGQARSGVANQIHRELYGTYRGTAPLSLWGSTWHNFGFVGSLIVAMMLAFFHHIWFQSLFAEPKSVLTTPWRITATLLLGYWFTGGPMTLVNAGWVTAMLLWGLGRLLRARISSR